MPASQAEPAGEKAARNFIQQIIDQDLNSGKRDRVHTRFPPEPNGYLHIGHAKSILLNYGLSREYGGKFNLRFDDTNPTKEEQEFVDSIIDDVRWLGADWEDRLFFASDYFDRLYDWAVQLIESGGAYVCDLSADEMREYRGTLTEPGRESPYRDRSIKENLDLFERMKAGEFPDGSRTLRAKIDMAAANINLRDPVMYRIKHASHHRTGDKWCIYPSYDYTHGQSDSIEGITHSVCTLEFEDHRPLYDWFLEALGVFHPQQIEFARLNLTYAVMSKRKLLQLVQEGHVAGWNDPRMLTIRGLRRRGYTSESIQAFCERVGVAKFNSTIDMAWLEDAIREDLNAHAPRRMAVLRPLKVVLIDSEDELPKSIELANHPQDESRGTRDVKMGHEIYIEEGDFEEDPPKKFFRFKPGGSVRLRGAGIATCQKVIKNSDGQVSELHCSFTPDTTALIDGKKVKGTVHWVDAETAIDAEVRLYDHLFAVENPDKAPEGGTFLDNLNPRSLEVLSNAKLEPNLSNAVPGSRYQFERNGYFVVDSVDSQPGKLVFNRTATLRDSWAKTQKR